MVFEIMQDSFNPFMSLNFKILSEKSRLSSVFWKMSGMKKLLFDVYSYHSLWYPASNLIPQTVV